MSPALMPDGIVTATEAVVDLFPPTARKATAQTSVFGVVVLLVPVLSM